MDRTELGKKRCRYHNPVVQRMPPADRPRERLDRHANRGGNRPKAIRPLPNHAHRTGRGLTHISHPSLFNAASRALSRVRRRVDATSRVKPLLLRGFPPAYICGALTAALKAQVSSDGARALWNVALRIWGGAMERAVGRGPRSAAPPRRSVLLAGTMPPVPGAVSAKKREKPCVFAQFHHRKVAFAATRRSAVDRGGTFCAKNVAAETLPRQK